MLGVGGGGEVGMGLGDCTAHCTVHHYDHKIVHSTATTDGKSYI